MPIVVPGNWCSFRQNPAVKLGSRSDTMLLGIPCSLKISSGYITASSCAVIVLLMAFKCTILGNRSTKTAIETRGEAVTGKTVIKSNETVSQRVSRLDKGCSLPQGCPFGFSQLTRVTALDPTRYVPISELGQ
jgi:hypothetical protein